MDIADYSRMLIVMDEGIGNMLDLTPALRVLKDLKEDLQISVLGQYPALDVVKGTPFVSEVLESPLDRSYEIGVFAIWYNYTSKPFQSQIVSQCKRMFALDYNTPDRPEWWHYLEIPRLFGWQGNKAKPFCAVSKSSTQLDPERVNVAIADTAAVLARNKKWPHYAELARVLTDLDYQVILVGGEKEAEEFQVDRWPSGVVNLLGKLSVPETGHVLLQCDLVIGNDCGIAQMAAVLDVPTLFVFGPTYVPKNYPLGDVIKVVRRDLDCAPCQFTDRWAQCTDWQCMESLKVDDVIQAIVNWHVHV
jgi:ADP-heptose:LPS heptosyltransferase